MPGERSTAARWWVPALLALFAAGVGFWLARTYFLWPPNRMPLNHERHHYVYRLVEFRDLLAAGYWSPQWATHFRGGLGSPYFSYYQPGFFYLASLVPWSVDPLRALGLVIIAGLVFGCVATFAFVRSRFGTAAGVVGAIALLAAFYPRVEIVVRGDLSEFTAMMLVPWALQRFLDAFERGRLRDLAGLAIAVAAIVCTHPAVGLFLGLALGVALVAFTAVGGAWWPGARVVTALAVGVGLAGFYALPVALEIEHVSSELAFGHGYHYTRHWVSPLELFDPAARHPFPVVVGTLVVAVAALNIAWFLARPATWPPGQRRFLGFVLLLIGFLVFLMSPASAFVWSLVPPLEQVQFPGRALAVVTPALALAAGAVGGTVVARWRWAGGVALVLVALAQNVAGMKPGPRLPFAHVTNAADLVTAQHFRPDVADEWLPRGADILRREDVPFWPVVTGGGCVARGFWRRQGVLEVHIDDNPDGCLVTLPHFFFPLGWRAAADGTDASVRLEQGPRGLMQLAVPPAVEGRVETRFTMTPMRRLGWLVTALSATVGMGLLRRLAAGHEIR